MSVPLVSTVWLKQILYFIYSGRQLNFFRRHIGLAFFNTTHRGKSYNQTLSSKRVVYDESKTIPKTAVPFWETGSTEPLQRTFPPLAAHAHLLCPNRQWDPGFSHNNEPYLQPTQCVLTPEMLDAVRNKQVARLDRQQHLREQFHRNIPTLEVTCPTLDSNMWNQVWQHQCTCAALKKIIFTPNAQNQHHLFTFYSLLTRLACGAKPSGQGNTLWTPKLQSTSPPRESQSLLL